MEELIKNYIEEELEEINDVLDNEEEYHTQYSIKAYKEDKKYLENISEEKIKEIAQKVENDSELEAKINDLIHYYLYH